MAVRAVRPLGARALGLAMLLAATPFLLPPAQAASGGPDAYGYVWVDSRAPSPVVPYMWRDITSSGTRVALSADDCTFEIAMGFQFRFYGILVDQIHVCSDGFVTFSLQGFGLNSSIPDPAPPNDRVVALGMDLFPPTNGSAGVFVLPEPFTVPKRFTVTWNEVVTQYTSDRQTFQVILEQNSTSRDGRILLQYRTLTNLGFARIGIENRTGSSGLEYPYAPSNGLAVAFLPPSDAGLPPDTLTVTPTVLAPASTIQGARNVPMLQLDVATLSNEALVSGLIVQLSGVNAGPSDVPTASLWLDDGDGTFSPLSDFRLGIGVIQLAPTIAMFTLVPSVGVSMALPQRMYVAYDIAPGARPGNWIGARMAASSAVSVEFPDVVAAAGFPAETYIPNTQTRIDASIDTLVLLSATDRVPGNVAQWQTDVPLMSIELGVASNIVDVAGLTLEIGGNATAAEVWRVKALEDVDRNGSYTPGIDVVLAVVSPAGVPLVADLAFSRTIVAGAPAEFLILFDVGPEATGGGVANFTLNVTGIKLAPGGADVLSPANLPVTTGNTTIGPDVRPSLSTAWSVVSPAADGAWAFGEYILGPSYTDVLDPPAGNGVAGYLTVQNNATMLSVAIDATGDGTSSPLDGVAIGFDTDRDGLPTNASDDVYVANATGGARLLYNDTAGAWLVNATCGPVGGNDTTPGCAAAFGPTELLDTPHRFYEFAIPLGLLGVPTPVGPGTVLRFALAAPPHDGLASEAGRSTWPILLDPLPSLRHFADLNLVAAPTPNRVPTLNWTDEPGYAVDGLEPESGLRDEAFVWRVLYEDDDEHPPAYAQPRVHVFQDGIAIPGSPFAMTEADPSDLVYSDGKVYVQSVVVHECGGNFTYSFTARDAIGGVALSISGTGPAVACPDLPPELLFPRVSPSFGLPGTQFYYRIAYQDAENRSAWYVEATIALDGSDQQTIPLSPTSLWVGTPGDYAQGRFYEGNAVLVLVSANYTYRFQTSDGNTTVDSGPFLGPEVVPRPPDVLRVSFGDLAPLESDEGEPLVEFLQLILYTFDPEVNVTSVRIDRIGTASDGEVLAVLLYDDVDASGSVSPGDVLLGSRPLLLGFASFPVALRVTPANLSSLLVVANLNTPGTADATVGFELSASASIGIAAGDTVQSFSSMRSTRTLINVRPRVEAPAVEGASPGTNQISHIVAGAPVIAWRFEDNNSADLLQAAYNVSVWSETPPALLWFRNETTSASSALYAGPSLVPGDTYRARILLYDDRLWSAPLDAIFRRNTPPAPPTLLDPPDLAADLLTDVTLTWQPQTDPEADSVRYYWWASASPGFSPAFSGSTFSSSAALAVAAGTEYFWKVGASDGYEFTSGNATVWRFNTLSPTAPVLGDIRGRVMNGTTGRALGGAFVELLNGTAVEDVNITGADGTFRFEGIVLGSYAVRVRALGFVERTLPAEPTRAGPSVDLGDIVLTPVTEPGGPGQNGGDVALSWLPIVVAIVLIVLTILGILAFRRRSRQEESPGADESPDETGGVEPSVASEPSASEPASELSRSDVLSAGVVFECPVCSRLVTTATTRCVCGAEFDG